MLASDGPIPLIGPGDLKFTPTDSGLQAMVADTLGNEGTDSDGFDPLLNDALNLAADAGSILASFDGDLTDAGTALPFLDNTDAADQQGALSSAATATDTALGDYTSVIPAPPDAGKGTGSTPPTGKCPAGTKVGDVTVGSPDPKAYPDLSPPTGHRFHTAFPVMCTGDTPMVATIETATLCYDRSNWEDVILGNFDTSMWERIITDKNNDGHCWIRQWDLKFTPKKAGRFSCTLRFDLYYGPYQFYFKQFDITIVDPPAKT